MTPADGVLILSALGVGAILREITVALLQRRKLGADAVSVLTAAARDLVEPLSKELAEERAQVRQLRDESAALRRDLEAAHTQVQALRAELALCRVDADALRQERTSDKRRLRDLEARLRKH